MMSELRVKKAKSIGSLDMSVPGDRAISHRAVILSAISNGSCRIEGFLATEDTIATVRAIQSLGIRVDMINEEGEVDHRLERPGELVVHGRGGILNPPSDNLDCRSSEATMTLMAGLLASQPFNSVLQGDAELSRRPMNHVIEPLLHMGSEIESMGGDKRPPLMFRGDRPDAITYELGENGAEVKSAILLAGLFAEGKTSVLEPVPVHNHTECLLRHFQVKTVLSKGRATVYGPQIPESRDIQIPGDLSLATPWLVATGASQGGQLNLTGVGLNPTRTGILNVLVNMGARISEAERGNEGGETMGDIVAQGQGLRGVRLGGTIIPRILDEIPFVAIAGALAVGRTIIRDAESLRLCSVDRIAALLEGLKAMGAQVVEHRDGLEIEGGVALRGARVRSHGDPQIARAFAVAGLFAEGETTIEDGDCASVDYPDFQDDLFAFAGQRKIKPGEKVGGLFGRKSSK